MSGEDGTERAVLTQATDFQANLVMVVARSPVNRVVVSRIVERAGLKALAVEPAEAIGALAARRPALVVVDSDAESEDALPLSEAIRAQRLADSRFPVAILLAQRGGGDGHDPLFDAVVPKPITPEMLQPIVERLLALQ